MTTNRPSDNALQAAEIVVEQRHRDAAADLIEEYWSGADAGMMKLATSYRKGHSHGAFVRAFARFERDHMPSTDTQAAKVEDGIECDLIERLLDAQQDINFAANTRMDQSLCDASALIDEIEPILRRALASTPSPVTDETALSGEVVADYGSANNHVFDDQILVGGQCIAFASQPWTDRIIAALASTPQPAVAEGVWLIERRCSPPQWATIYNPSGIGCFYSDVQRAHRFASYGEASEAMRRMRVTPEARAEFFVSEHIWLGQTAAPIRYAGMDEAEFEDWIADVITDSLDMDWTGRIGAKAIVRALTALRQTAKGQTAGEGR